MESRTIMKKPIIAASFSGGETSGVMTKLLFDKYSATHNVVITFANTGQEHENTLKFVNDCDKHFGWNVVWIEAVVNPEKGKGIRHKVVTYETAARNGEPLEADFAKHGLPGPGWMHCTRDTKELPIEDYFKSVHGLKKGEYPLSIGIRADEMDRMSPARHKRKIIYPLIDAKWTKEDVKAEIASWPFQLELESAAHGNCLFCFKKSRRKLLTLAKESPHVFDFAKKVEELYSTRVNFKPMRVGVLWVLGWHVTTTYMFRDNMTATDLIDMANTLEFEPYRDQNQTQMFSNASYDLFLDTGSACGESCEIGADD
tara:strand:+ start:161 stop:1102 length:942 start_codon:yes stop_codon:yes gene_type:complete